MPGAKLQFHPETFELKQNTANGIQRIKCNIRRVDSVGERCARDHSPERQQALKPHCRFWQPLAVSA